MRHESPVFRITLVSSWHSHKGNILLTKNLVSLELKKKLLFIQLCSKTQVNNNILYSIIGRKKNQYVPTLQKKQLSQEELLAQPESFLYVFCRVISRVWVEENLEVKANRWGHVSKMSSSFLSFHRGLGLSYLHRYLADHHHADRFFYPHGVR